LPKKTEKTECSETSAYKIQTPGNYPEENIQLTEHGESLISRIHEEMFRKGSKTFYIKFYKSTIPTKLGVLTKVSHYTIYQNMKATGNMIALVFPVTPTAMLFVRIAVKHHNKLV
jgi:hypothetical protein